MTRMLRFTLRHLTSGAHVDSKGACTSLPLQPCAANSRSPPDLHALPRRGWSPRVGPLWADCRHLIVSVRNVNRVGPVERQLCAGSGVCKVGGSGLSVLEVKFYRKGTLLHKLVEGQTSPFPGQTHPTGSVMGMPSAV